MCFNFFFFFLLIISLWWHSGPRGDWTGNLGASSTTPQPTELTSHPPYVLTFEGSRWMDFLILEPGLGEGPLRDRVRVLLWWSEEVIKSLGPMQPEEEPEKLPREHLRLDTPNWEWEDQFLILTLFFHSIGGLPSLSKGPGWSGFSCVTADMFQAQCSGSCVQAWLLGILSW